MLAGFAWFVGMMVGFWAVCYGELWLRLYFVWCLCIIACWGVGNIWLTLGLVFNDWCLVILLFKVC